MRSKLVLVAPTECDMKNVIFLGDSYLNSIEYKRVRMEDVTSEETAVCFEACGCRRKLHKIVYDCGNTRPCTVAVVRRTPEDVKRRQAEVEKKYPHTKF